MATVEPTGAVSGLWRFPVKSMGGEWLEQAHVTASGLAGDRSYALMEQESGKVVSARSVKHFPGILDCLASFVPSSRTPTGRSPVQITLPDGATVTTDSGEIDQVLSRHFQRAVRLAQTAPDDYSIDQYHPDIEDVDPAGYRDTVVEQKLGSAYFGAAGLESPVSAGAYFDLFPLSVITTSTLRRLQELQPGSRFDQRRFRMNLIVQTGEDGFVENDWVSRQLSIGGEVKLRIAMPDPRCVMTTLPQGDLPRDTDVMRTLIRHNRLEIAPSASYPCAGVYAVVETPGTIRTGDSVAIS